MNIRKGAIVSFHGHGSGLATLEEEGIRVAVPCDNGVTVRELDSAFGGVIQPGHRVDVSAIVGQEIYWTFDEFGLILGGFCPVEQASLELMEAYESQGGSNG